MTHSDIPKSITLNTTNTKSGRCFFIHPLNAAKAVVKSNETNNRKPIDKTRCVSQIRMRYRKLFWIV